MNLMGEVPHEDLEYCTIDLVDWDKWDEVLRGFKNLQQLTFIRMDEPSWGRRYYESYEPRGPLPRRFVRQMRAFIKERLLSLEGKDVLHFA